MVIDNEVGRKWNGPPVAYFKISLDFLAVIHKDQEKRQWLYEPIITERIKLLQNYWT
jgi:hypothetical protein